MAPNDLNRQTRTLLESVARREAQPEFQRAEGALTAYRLLNGPGDGGPAGLAIDRYGEWLVVSARTHMANAAVDSWLQAAREALQPRGIVLKRLAPKVRESTSRVVWGDVPPERVSIQEGQVKLLCALDDGVQTGLFLDHRETRWLARTHAAGVEVLNLFAYTCAFSVHAAHAGAMRVTSVDVSKKALDWGRDNLAANGLSADAHRWFADDAVRHVGRGPDEQYGLVILDPPVFGRAKGRTFSLSADLGALLEGAFRKLVTGGFLIFSTHAQALDEAAVRAATLSAARAVGARARVVEQRGLPSWDHPVDPKGPPLDEDRGNYLKTLVLEKEAK